MHLGVGGKMKVPLSGRKGREGGGREGGRGGREGGRENLPFSYSLQHPMIGLY